MLTSTRVPKPISAALAVVLAASLLGCGSGGEASAGTVRVVDATLDVPPNPSVGAVRMVLRNDTGTADALVGASSSDARTVSVHRSQIDDEGRSVMTAVERLDLPARSEVTFEPGGLHVMLEGIERELVAGDTVTLEVELEEAGTLEVEVDVVEPGTSDIGSGGDDDHQHSLSTHRPIGALG